VGGAGPYGPAPRMTRMSLLEVTGVAKRYGPVVALRSADLKVEPGEIHALMGANGAGKSTLVKVLTGVISRDAGDITVDGQPVRIGSPRGARQVGLAPVFQDPALLPDLTVLQNLRLTGADAGRVLSELEAMGVAVDLTELVSDLPLPALRMIDLARALSFDPRLLLLDEITAALPSDLADTVSRIVRDVRDRGGSVLFISHRLAEVSALCDKATVLRDGKAVGTLVPRAGEEERIVELMLGESRDKLAAGVEAAAAEAPADIDAVETEAEAGKPVLEVRALKIDDRYDRTVDLEVRAGEIVGVAALEGQGQDAMFELLAGQRRVRGGGEIVVNGRTLKARHPYDAIRAGMVLVPADRMMALLPQRPVSENVAAPLYNRIARWGPIRMRDERRRVGDAIEKLQIDTRAASQARRLSGGNRQKLTIARWLAAGFQVMLCFDPTRGIDVGTKRQIYVLLRELADAGAAILLFTSELPEIQLVCDRVIVLYQGGVSERLPAGEATEGRLLRAAHGLVDDKVAS
jgi:ribose transport system ATP-binding protein